MVDNRPRPEQAPQIRNEPLFGNYFITNTAGNPVKKPRRLQQSPGTLSLVGHLTYYPAPGIMPPEAIIEEHDVQIPAAKVVSITASVPADWRRALSKPDPPIAKNFLINSPVDGKQVEISTLTPRSFYEFLRW